MIPYVSIVGKSGVGKTTLIEKLIAEFKRRGLRVAIVKHHAHVNSLDIAGKDSYRFSQAGADSVIVSSPVEIMRFERLSREKTLVEIVDDIQGVDLVLSEGFKREKAPQIEVVRASHGTDLISSPDDLIAVASDYTFLSPARLFDLDDPASIAEFLVAYMGLRPDAGG